MKIKVLITDDEKLERVLIRKGYNWEENGFEIIGEASNGREALEFFDREPKPDIVLTDINMPVMDGLTLAEKILEGKSGCRVVIITGYREFDFAQRAVRLGVTDYLLKPLDFVDIEHTMRGIKEEIEAESNSEYGIKPADLRPYPEKTKKMNRIIQNAVRYIEENLSDPELNLKSVAAAVFVNESYLSRIFRQETGERLIEYITRQRIELSKRLLTTTDLKSYEIAEAVGIGNPHYFSICFKKLVGKTVTEYKNNE